MPHQEEIDKVPADTADQVVQDFKDAGATSVTKAEDASGTYTIIATFP
jgi:hypothetical protein